MNKKITISKIIIALLLSLTSLAASIDVSLMSPDPVASSLGNLATFVEPNNLWSVHRNQTGLGLVDSKAVGFSYKRAIGELHHYCLAGAFPFKVGALGLLTSFVNNGHVTDAMGEEQLSRDLYTVIGYGAFVKGFGFGLGTKLLGNNLVGDKAIAFLIDLNLRYHLPVGTEFGLNVSDICISKKASAPTLLSLGISHKFRFGSRQDILLQLGLEPRLYLNMNYQLDVFDMSIFMNYGMKGVRFQFAVILNQNAPFMSAANFGVGYEFEKIGLRIDYALSSYTTLLGLNNTIAVSTYLGKKQKRELPQKDSIKTKTKKKDKKEDPTESTATEAAPAEAEAETEAPTQEDMFSDSKEAETAETETETTTESPDSPKGDTGISADDEWADE